MDTPAFNDADELSGKLRLALEQAEAEARLREAETPDRLNEDWRFGRPHIYAKALVSALESDTDNAGRITIQAPAACVEPMADDMRDGEMRLRSIGSDKILGLHLKRFGKGICLCIDTVLADPIIITYETEGVFTPSTIILAAEGAAARIIERHIVRGSGLLVATRDIKAMAGADISLELEVSGESTSGSDQPRAMNITNIAAMDAQVRQLTRYSGLDWAREETVAEILHENTTIELFSANRLHGTQILDQHTRQIHSWGKSTSNLLYKNVVDGSATATFAGNIYVAPGAHETDAYQANRNMLLSEDATINSLPGLEILADKVRCSHGSASAPMDEEQLFYLLSRGIPRHDAQMLVADGFLADAVTRFRGSESDGNNTKI